MVAVGDAAPEGNLRPPSGNDKRAPKGAFAFGEAVYFRLGVPAPAFDAPAFAPAS